MDRVAQMVERAFSRSVVLRRLSSSAKSQVQVLSRSRYYVAWVDFSSLMISVTNDTAW